MLKISIFPLFWISCVLSQNEPIPPSDDDFFSFEWQSAPNRGFHGEFLRKMMNIILDKGLFTIRDTYERFNFDDPDTLPEKFDFSLSEDPTNHDELYTIIEKLFELSNRPGHKFRHNRRVAGLDPLAVAGDWMAATMSNLVVTYQVAPIWTLMEISMTKYLSKKIGWEKEGDGVPTTGAGSGNSMALAVAMQRRLGHDFRDVGHATLNGDRPFVIYVSRYASISWKTAALYNTLGTTAVCEIGVDEIGRMDTRLLEERIKADRPTKTIVMVVGTAGTPILGVIDPLSEIADLCHEYGIWFHVDAELAGGYLFASDATGNKYRARLNGIEMADSVLVSMWLLSVPYPSSFLLTKDPDAMQNTFGLHASYVFTGIDNYNMSYDRGDHTIQTSRRPEISKMWFAAQRGERDIFILLESQEEARREFFSALSKRKPNFVTASVDAEALRYKVPLVSFYYVKNELLNLPHDEEFFRIVSVVTIQTQEALRRSGLLDISVSTIQGASLPTMFTMSFTNNLANGGSNDLNFNWILDLIAKAAEHGDLPDDEPFPEYTDFSSQVLLPNYPWRSVYLIFMRNALALAYNGGLFFGRKERAFNLQQPDLFEDGNVFDFHLPATLSDGQSILNKISQSFEKIIHYSPHWAHPYFIYQLAAGLDPYTYVADLIVPVLNTPMISYYDGSAPFMLMERELIKQMVKRIFKRDVGDGIITDGGSMANQIAFQLAKSNYDRVKNTDPNVNVKCHGMKAIQESKYVVFTSQDAHYSTKKGAIFQGLGQNYTVEIESNSNGQMRVDKLIEAVVRTREAGDIPLMIVITAGTTIYGAIDSIDEIVSICNNYFVWCHVDGMFGGLVAMSDDHIHKFAGIEKADSWGADLHKLMGSTMVCSILITPHHDMMRQAFSLPDEDEIQQEQEGDPKYNLLGRHAQLDKRNNIFKFWFLWKAKGRLGLQEHVETIMRNKDYLIDQIRRREDDGFELVLDNYDLTNICFRLIPRELNPKFTPGLDRNSESWKKSMDKFTFELEKTFVKNGRIAFVTQHRHQADGTDTDLFIKFVMMGSALTAADITYLLDALLYHSKEISLDSRHADQGDEIPMKNRFDPFGNLPKYYAI